jgi:hypothetical protein
VVEERTKFKNFHNRVAALVREVVAQTSNDRLLSRRTQEKLERHIIEQSHLLKESERERGHLRNEIEIARKAEATMRTTVVEIERRADAAVRNLNLESVRLEGALDRANGERTRLSYELANIKHRPKTAKRPSEFSSAHFG